MQKARLVSRRAFEGLVPLREEHLLLRRAALWRSLRDRANVRGLKALGALLDLELNLLPFSEAAKAIGLNRSVVAENVFAAAILSDEAKALRIVEPLDGTSCHFLFFFFRF
jgi:hypothetical protein